MKKNHLKKLCEFTLRSLLRVPHGPTILFSKTRFALIVTPLGDDSDGGYNIEFKAHSSRPNLGLSG
jgi:hypothetical protein